MTGKTRDIAGVPARGARPRPKKSAVKPTTPRKSPKRPPAPPPLALELAAEVSTRVRHRPVAIRNGFIENLYPATPGDPPLAVTLRGGQGGAVRLKLLLSMLWFSVQHPHATDYPSRSWAALLGLSEPDTNGARRVAAAMDWLETANLVEVQRRPGSPSRVILRDERGVDEEYTLPYDAWKAKSDAGEEITRDDLYITLPPTLWTKGWITILSGPAVAMLLVMTLEARFAGRLTGLWHSSSQAKGRFALSADSRKAGLAELTELGILEKSTQPVSRTGMDRRRRRNVYDLHLEQLDVLPGEARPATGVDEEAVLAPETVEVVDDTAKTEP